MLKLESSLDSSKLSDYESLSIKGYELVTEDHPDDAKRGGVCAYFKQSLPVRGLSNPYLKECPNSGSVYKKQKKK